MRLAHARRRLGRAFARWEISGKAGVMHCQGVLAHFLAGFCLAPAGSTGIPSGLPGAASTRARGFFHGEQRLGGIRNLRHRIPYDSISILTGH
ncbi:hypothetical protein BD310DRAFT_929746 [Dichomitus squalens]|uniref:Uncharacterized protein n=1 Tax=Dichomitus squalens TaxID=114155 RepID=A0A4Q9PSF6_9APHY|nr:hypothetical protein BD310DRAFT_929746 [Dichomitus squalens]